MRFVREKLFARKRGFIGVVHTQHNLSLIQCKFMSNRSKLLRSRMKCPHLHKKFNELIGEINPQWHAAIKHCQTKKQCKMQSDPVEQLSR